MDHKFSVFKFDDIEVREREFLLVKGGEASAGGTEGVPRPSVSVAQSQEAGDERRDPERGLE